MLPSPLPQALVWVPTAPSSPLSPMDPQQPLSPCCIDLSSSSSSQICSSPLPDLSHPRESSLQQPPLTGRDPLLCPPPALSSAAGSVSQLHPQWHFVTVGGWREGVAWPGPQRSEQSPGERALPPPTPPHLILPSLSLSPSGPTQRPTGWALDVLRPKAFPTLSPNPGHAVPSLPPPHPHPPRLLLLQGLPSAVSPHPPKTT